MSSISTYIQNDLAARLRAGRELPTTLTIDALADHYDVSFTPVRTAVAKLLDEGLLIKGANRRLAPVRLTNAKARGAKSKETSALRLPDPPQDPFARIVNDLLQQSLLGEAVYLREEATAEKYGVSRSTIRHTFYRLAGEGMLNHIPRHGWQLRPFRQSDLDAFIDVREVLELKALELARKRLDKCKLQRMLAANMQPVSSVASPLPTPQIDESLHVYLFEASGNGYIREFFERQGRYYRLLFEWEDRDRATALETARQHRQILLALLDENWSKARKELSQHIRDHHPLLSQLNPKANAGRADVACGENLT